ncbi:hypothetical protein GOODEAATRI_000240, partial [Goodea atripinnis]
VKLVNIRNDDIADGNPKLTLGLIWTIILHFQVSSSVNGQSEDMTAKEKLLLWSQRLTEGYQGIRCDNFTTSWRDGKLFNAVIHRHYPRLIDMGKVYRQTNLENLEQAFGVAERDLGVTRLLDPEGSGAALAGILRAGDPSAPVDPPPCHHLRGEKVPQQLRGDRAQHTAEVDRELDKAENTIRLLFNDVQILKDGRHPQAEQMYRRVYHIHERLVNLRSDYNLRLKVSTVQVPITQSQQSTSMKVRPELDDVTLHYVQDLLAWVEENQRRIEKAEWGSDLPSVESQLASHRGLHQTVEDFKSKIARANGLNKKSRTIIQLKPRNSITPIKGKLPIQAVCDFKQQEITVHKGDECALLNNSQPFKWKVLNRSGNEAVVPSVCFLVPPVNKEAVDSVSRIILMQIKGNHISIFLICLQLKTMKPEDYRMIMRNLEVHYQDFMRDSQDSQLFSPNDRIQVEEDYTKVSQHFDNLLSSMEKGQQDETLCKNYICEIKDLRLRIEDCELQTVARIRKPVAKEPLKECSQKRTEQQGADGVLKQYEDCLREVHAVPSDIKEVETQRSKLKISANEIALYYCQLYCHRQLQHHAKMRAEAESEQPVFDSLEEELKKASAVSNKMSCVHTERDIELDHYRQLTTSLQDRWRAVFTQIDLRQRELEQLGRQLGYYRDSYDWLIRWIDDAKQRQENIQAVPITNSKTLKDQLAQEKV